MAENTKARTIEVEEEESIFDKIASLTTEVNQMEWMIEENIRLIAEGDDVEGRTFLKQHLEMEVRKKKAEIAKLEAQM
jgi:hypothetical protein